MLALHCYQSDSSRAAKIGTHAETQRRREESLCVSASLREIKNRSLILARLRLGRPECSRLRHGTLNASLRHESASSPRADSITTLTHTSLVVIMLMLMPRLASAPNIVRATPVCVRIPTP